MLDELLLLSGNDIPFFSAQVSIHQPTLKEIAYIGEENFFVGCELLKFSKDSLTSEDKNNLKDKTNFDIIMSIMKDKTNLLLMQNTVSAYMVLGLLFPGYAISINKDCIELIKGKELDEEQNEVIRINNKNYEEFKDILINMFCLVSSKESSYNPSGDLAQQIADKLKKGAQKRAQLRGEGKKKIAILGRYASILAVGLSKDINSLMQYTVYQLFDEFQRFELKINYDLYLQAKMAGAKDLKEVDQWTKDIHE